MKKAARVIAVVAALCAASLLTAMPSYRVKTPHAGPLARLGTMLELALPWQHGALTWSFTTGTAHACMDPICDGSRPKMEACYNPQTGGQGPCICWPGGCASMYCAFTGHPAGSCEDEILPEPCWGCREARNVNCIPEI